MSVNIVLPANLSIADIESVYADISSRLNETGPLELDAGAIERIDTSGVQLLLALVREGERSNRAVSWKASSEALKSCAETLGLRAVLKL